MPDPVTTASADTDDLGASLEKNWDAVASDDSSSDDTAPASASDSAPSTPPSSEGESADAARDAARARDAATGKFVKGKAAPPAVAAAPAAPGAPVAAAPAPAAGAPEFKIPEKWPADVKAKLAEIHAVAPAHAQFLLEQYGHMRAVSAQHYNKSQEHLRQYESLLAPGRQARALKGIDDAGYVRNLIAAGDFLDKSPVEGIKYLMKTYGVDLQHLTGEAGGQAAEIPPYVSEVKQEVQAIKQFIAAQTQGAQQQQMKAAADWIDSFSKKTDAQGQPMYPHFDECLPEIIVNVQYQMNSGQAVDVDAAYKRAVRMNDTVWLKDERARSAAAEQAAAAQRIRDIEDAKRAGISVSGSGADTRAEVPDDIGKNLERNYDKLFS